MMRSAEIVSFRRVPIGRLVYALTEVATRAEQRGLPQVAAYAEAGARRGREVMKASMRRAAGVRGRYVPEAAELDRAVDGVLAGLDSYLFAQQRAYAGEPQGQAATVLRQALFPDGVRTIATLPYARQQAHVSALVARAGDPDLAHARARLAEFAPLLARLEVLNQRHGEALRRDREVPSARELADGRAHSQDLLAETTAIIVSHFALSAPDDREGREYLLAPILEQVAASRRRRPAPDIEPDAGPGGEPGAGPGTDAGSGPEVGAGVGAADGAGVAAGAVADGANAAVTAAVAVMDNADDAVTAAVEDAGAANDADTAASVDTAPVVGAGAAAGDHAGAADVGLRWESGVGTVAGVGSSTGTRLAVGALTSPIGPRAGPRRG